jgi:predicted transcriptional regulator
MACVRPDGSITDSAKAMLESLKTPKSPEEVSMANNLPLFKVRSSFREMLGAGLIVQDGDQYKTSEAGLSKLA